MSAQPEEIELVARAVDGDKAALEQVLCMLQDPLYRLALRMVRRPPEAEDATQEILIRVLTRLSSWRSEAKLLTWAYRVGVNYLLNLRRDNSAEVQAVSFEEFRDGLADGLADAEYRGPEALVLADEVRLSCTQAMLQCLERHERIAFVLGEIFELNSADSAWILDTTPAAFRKRLERARTRIGGFMHLRPGQPRRALPLHTASASSDRPRPDRSRKAGVCQAPRDHVGPRRRSGRRATGDPARRGRGAPGAPGLRRTSIKSGRDRRPAALRAIPNPRLRRAAIQPRRSRRGARGCVDERPVRSKTYARSRGAGRDATRRDTRFVADQGLMMPTAASGWRLCTRGTLGQVKNRIASSLSRGSMRLKC
jgi:RNA polymerase sigma factor (sigma-70 family)